jgi:hypothetical protein
MVNSIQQREDILMILPDKVFVQPEEEAVKICAVTID